MIYILLASYNGEKYIREQIHSLLNQTVQDFKLFISDDKSTDSTYYILQNYEQQYPDKIFVSQNKVNTGSAKYNFIKMMIEHKSDYIMLCDQDDVWLSDKIEKSINKIKEMEQLYGADTPILVHSDLRVVDENLNIISESFMKLSKIDYKKKSLNSLMVQNIITGCTAIYNRALADLIVSEPEYMMMHDWWLALVAGAFGQIGTIYESSIVYRQHIQNSVGAKNELSFSNIFSRLINYKRIVNSLNSTYKQTKSFLALYNDKFSKEQQNLLSAYASILNQSKIKRLQILFKYKIFMPKLIRKIAQILIVLTERNEHS